MDLYSIAGSRSAATPRSPRSMPGSRRNRTKQRGSIDWTVHGLMSPIGTTRPRHFDFFSLMRAHARMRLKKLSSAWVRQPLRGLAALNRGRHAAGS
jgi:hypothetical protein